MKTLLIAFGTLSHPGLREAADEYVRRLGKDFEEIELREIRLPDRPSEKEMLRALDGEADRVFGKIPEGACVISLCVEGETLSSEKLAKKEEEIASRGFSALVYVVGSSYGLSEKVKERSFFRLSLSPMTFPHQLARVVLLEQIYRAREIRKNSKYHK